MDNPILIPILSGDDPSMFFFSNVTTATVFWVPAFAKACASTLRAASGQLGHQFQGRWGGVWEEMVQEKWWISPKKTGGFQHFHRETWWI